MVNTKKSWKTNYTALLLAETLAITGFAVSMPVIPLYLKDDIGLSDPNTLKIWTGVIQSTSAVMLAIFSPIWGHIADLYSKRAMLLRAMGGGMIVVSAMSFVANPWQLLVLRGIQGALTGTAAAAIVLVTGIVPQASIPLALGLLQTGIAVGNSLGPLIGGLVSDFLGRRIAFLCTGFILLCAFIIVACFVHDEEKIREEELSLDNDGKYIKKKTTLSARAKKFIPNLGPILSSTSLLSLIVVAFAIQVANNTANPILPLFINQISQGTRFLGSSTGIVLGAGAAATAIAAIISGKFAGKIGYWKTLCFCLAAACVAIIPQAFSQNIYQLCVIHIAASFFIGGAVPVMQVLISESTERRHQGSVFGWTSSASMLGGALGPMIGSAAAMISYHAVFPITSLILGLASLGLFLRRRKK
ncbi:MAG: MFS transporter [Spirochaetaceae bacterium]|jgi:MFS family permease|nr:MFS transporter [Spirochaetaceae bacterium]